MYEISIKTSNRTTPKMVSNRALLPRPNPYLPKLTKIKKEPYIGAVLLPSL